ncbi:MAG: response regulator [candidate division Zixibacteria bacterium]|nr:response regulator [candidate division Zixibacteria bacterium]
MEHTVLVVDDSPTIVKFVSFSLKNSGFSVLTASDGMDAIEKLSSHTEDIDLIITDLNMPNVDGYELISTLRRNSKYKDIPIIILSSEEEECDKQRGIEVGASSYLVKPFKSTILLREISKYLG